jgi:hypothetical protein
LGFSATGVNDGESLNKSSIPDADLLLLSPAFGGLVFSAFDASLAAVD